MKDNIEEHIQSMSAAQTNSLMAVTRELKMSQDEQNLMRNRIRELEGELHRVRLGILI
jgi:hypothetical protein